MDDPHGPAGPAEVARALVEAAFAPDIDEALKYCTPDMELTIEGVQTVYGPDGLRDVMEFNADVATNTRIEIHHVLASGDTAAVSRTTYLTIGGKDLQLEVGAFLEFRDGLVCRWVDYQDMRVVSETLGH